MEGGHSKSGYLGRWSKALLRRLRQRNALHGAAPICPAKIRANAEFAVPKSEVNFAFAAESGTPCPKNGSQLPLCGPLRGFESIISLFQAIYLPISSLTHFLVKLSFASSASC